MYNLFKEPEFRKAIAKWVVALIWLIFLAVVYWAGMSFDKQRELSLGMTNGDKLAEYFNDEFQHFSVVPKLIAENEHVLQFIASPKKDTRDSTNVYLQDIQRASSASDAYLLDSKGVVLASSNFKSDHSYVGNEYSFRHYFVNGRAQGHALEFAVGLRSNLRGFYFSQAITQAEQFTGVAVIKVNVNQFETDEAQLDTGESSHFAILSESNEIYASDVESWRLKNKSEFLEPCLNEKKAPLCYLNIEERRYLSFAFPLLGLKAKLVYMRDITDLPKAQWPRLGIATLIFIVFIWLVRSIYKRVTQYQRLIAGRRDLELKVQERTQKLEQTQAALIRAAKLATIGQLSASINHEINQPLSAISTYLASTKRLIVKAQYTTALDNVELIEGLMGRVSRIVTQLRQFSQTTENKMQYFELQPLIHNALVIAGPELKRCEIDTQINVDPVMVWVDPFKFEQVLVNLFTNAAHAMEKSTVKTLRIVSEQFDGKVKLSIQDSGPGIEQHQLATIFEPFYTTKSGSGLGLGLSISKEIIQSFSGILTAQSNSKQGAEFIITLNGNSVS
ncbi:ATP-binding protein [Pseudoalteromonas xiamenensis]